MISHLLDDFYGKTRPRTKRNKMGHKKSRPKSIAEATVWEINELPIPVDLFREPKRTTWRFAFVKGGKINVRIPLLESAAEAELLREIQKRLSERMLKKPQLHAFFGQKEYYNNDTVIVGTQQYILDVFIEKRKTNTARLVIDAKSKRTIELKLNAFIEEKTRQKAIATLISRVISADFLYEFSKRVHELNLKHFNKFNKKIKNISFKQNHSNWGSCSSTGNLNFSSRLLFAPPDVQEYVMIHELAHLVELNHSNNFWQLVANALPNYLEKEKWLKEHGSACRF